MTHSASQRTPRPLVLKAILGSLLKWFVLGLTVIVSAELTARIDDRVRSGTPILSVPDHNRDLVVHEGTVIHGRPHGRYERWILNNYGFRSPDTTVLPARGCTRIIALGASETFGLYESDGMEFPAQLNGLLSKQTAEGGGERSCYEVLNAAVTGLTLRGVIRLWTDWASRFKPAVVIIYPTPVFYLAPTAPAYPGPAGAAVPPPYLWPPRLLQRVQDRFDVPDFIQRRRVAMAVARERQRHPANWFFSEVPQERLAQFRLDVEVLVDAIQMTGALPIVLTHASGFSRPPIAADVPALDAWQQLVPRAASGAVLLAFDDGANDAIREVARNRNVGLADAASMMNGQPRWFADDYIHFSDSGAHEVAALIAGRILAARTSARSE